MGNKYRLLVHSLIVIVVALIFLSACNESERNLLPPSQVSNNSSPLNIYLKELSKTNFFQGSSTQGSYLYYHKWYEEKAPRHRSAFRLLGIVVVLLSVFLPVIVALENKIPKQKYIVIITSLIIALATGINSFYRFDVSWKGYISAQMQLESERNAWEAEIAEAKALPNPIQQLNNAKLVTESFISGVNEIIKTETTGYFKVQNMPKKE